jgi:hypothetical protein
MSGRRFEVCNGDADGLCATLQWRLHAPAPATLVTGTKREIDLLHRVEAAAGDEVLVCDISMQRNRAALDALLAQGVRVRYFDHHAVDEIPGHPLLETHIDLASDVCTSRLMDRHLAGTVGETRFRRWALVGTWGDNMDPSAERLADALGLPAAARQRLRELGIAINYNAYGETEEDLLVPPAELFAQMLRHPDPLAFADEPVAAQLAAQRDADLAQALAVPIQAAGATARVLLLPDAAWSRRISGSLANLLAAQRPDCAHAVATPRRDGSLIVSVRAPLASPRGTDVLCRRFGGAGRAAAGGIDRLPAGALERFMAALAGADWA